MKIKDITGQKFGKSTVLSFSHVDKNKTSHWLCKCDCGKQKILRGTSINTGKIRSCGCLKSHKQKNQYDLLGQRFGSLIVIEENGRYLRSINWKCQCDCGNIVNVTSSRLLRGVKSCKCRIYYRGADEIRFLENIEKTDSCWIWRSNVTKAGYGTLSIKGYPQYAHRYSYEYFKGSFDESLLVCHHCDNPPCVNPDHLFLGTHHDNTQDMMRKGRNKHEKN